MAPIGAFFFSGGDVGVVEACVDCVVVDAEEVDDELEEEDEEVVVEEEEVDELDGPANGLKVRSLSPL